MRAMMMGVSCCSRNWRVNQEGVRIRDNATVCACVCVAHFELRGLDVFRGCGLGCVLRFLPPPGALLARGDVLLEDSPALA